jgi:2-methylcitrate dehydratase PrpD
MRIALKFYSCVGSNHTTLDALRTMQARRPFGPSDIERITVHGSRVTVDHVGWPYEPQGLTSAQLNLPYCVATFLLEGDAFVDQFTEQKVADPERIALSRLVSVIEDPAITGRGKTFRHMVRVEAALRDGTVMQETVEAPRGSEHSFATANAVIDKFRKLAGRRMLPEQVDRIADAVLHAEGLDDAAALVRLLATG